MTENMIERMARAMHKRDVERMDGLVDKANAAVGRKVHAHALTHDFDQCSEIYKDLVRAALEAGREPTDDMKVAGLSGYEGERRGAERAVKLIGVIAYANVKKCWQAMIDEALK